VSGGYIKQQNIVAISSISFPHRNALINATSLSSIFIRTGGDHLSGIAIEILLRIISDIFSGLVFISTVSPQGFTLKGKLTG
ncbi:hypothetical protein, partial [Enterobacter cloacae]